MSISYLVLRELSYYMVIAISLMWWESTLQFLLNYLNLCPKNMTYITKLISNSVPNKIYNLFHITHNPTPKNWNWYSNLNHQKLLLPWLGKKMQPAHALQPGRRKVNHWIYSIAPFRIWVQHWVWEWDRVIESFICREWIPFFFWSIENWNTRGNPGLKQH